MEPLTNAKKTLKVKDRSAPDITRSSFLSHISHGIRTPLNSIMGFSRLLIDRPSVDSRNKEYAQRIVYSSNVLLNFVENLIDLSQYESKNYKLVKQPINLNDLAWRVVESFISKRHEQRLSDLDLVLVWESDTKDITIHTDYEILKKTICRLLLLVANIYIKGKIELGYRYTHIHQVRIFVRPDGNTINDAPGKNFLAENDDQLFNSFNCEVIENSVKLIGGSVCIDSIQNDYYIDLPVDYEFDSSNNEVQ